MTNLEKAMHWVRRYRRRERGLPGCPVDDSPNAKVVIAHVLTLAKELERIHGEALKAEVNAAVVMEQKQCPSTPSTSAASSKSSRPPPQPKATATSHTGSSSTRSASSSASPRPQPRTPTASPPSADTSWCALSACTSRISTKPSATSRRRFGVFSYS